jgi:hypothetical protein
MLVVLAAPPSAAAPSSKPALPNRAAVFVVAKDGAEGTAGTLEAKLLRALDDAKTNLVDLDSVFPPDAPDQTGEKLMKEAKEAYDNLDYDAAAAKYHDALEHFSQNPVGATSQALGEASFFTAVIALQNGGKSQAKKSQETFARALLHDPNLHVDAKTYGADVKKVFDKAVNEVAKRAEGVVKAESIPGGAEAMLRGKSLGLTPVTGGPSLPIGRHLLTFTRPGFAPSAVFVDVTKDGAIAAVALKVVQAYGEVRDSAASLVSSGFGTGKVPPGARKVGEVMKSRYLVVAQLGESGTGGLEVWDTETGSQLAGINLSDDASLKSAASQVKQFLANPSPLKAAAPVASSTTSSTKGEAPVASVEDSGGATPVYKKWWFWAAVGVVVVGGAAAGVAGGVASAPQPQPYNVVLGIP